MTHGIEDACSSYHSSHMKYHPGTPLSAHANGKYEIYWQFYISLWRAYFNVHLYVHEHALPKN